MTKFCTSCGHYRPEGDKFCGECGHRFPTQTHPCIDMCSSNNNPRLSSTGSTPPDSPTNTAPPSLFDTSSAFSSNDNCPGRWTPSCGIKTCSQPGVQVCKKCKKRLCMDHALVYGNKRPTCLSCAKKTLGYYLSGSGSLRSKSPPVPKGWLHNSEPNSPSVSPPPPQQKAPLIRSKSLLQGQEISSPTVTMTEVESLSDDHCLHHDQEIVLTGKVATLRLVVPYATVVVVREKEPEAHSLGN